MPRTGPIEKLRRYTHLPALLHILQTRTLTLLNPSTWPDQNDTTFLARYVAAKGGRSAVYALCMSEAASTFHHWSVYANGPAGVQIQLDPVRFAEWVTRTDPTARLDRVRYKRMREIGAAATNLTSLPFLKRLAFRDENEIRLLVEREGPPQPAIQLPEFDVTTILCVKLSPWLPAALEATVKDAILSACQRVDTGWCPEVRRTTLLYSEAFALAGAASPPPVA